MTTKDYIDIEIFPCAGGMGEGFRRAGVTFDLMIELEETHCDSYEANLGHRPTQMDARSFLEMLVMGWRPPKRVRMIVADPPCTPWSRAGKRLGQDDPRDMLDGTCRIIALLRPEVYLIGNVPGLDDGPNLPIVQKTIGSLSAHGYCTADFARLDAANYGVPQHRVRPFWFGHQHGPCIQWPAPTHGDPGELQSLTLPGITPLKPWVSCRMALSHLTAEELGRPVKLRHRPLPTKAEAKPASSDDQPVLDPSASTKKKRDRSKELPQGDRQNELDKPSATVTRNGGRARMGAASTLKLEPTEAPMTRKRKRDEGRATITIHPESHAMSKSDKPARTLTRNTHSDGAVIINTVIENVKHPNTRLDEVAPTLGAKARGQGAQVIVVSPNHPPSGENDPSNTIRATTGGGSNRALEWPWDQPSTTLQRDERIAPPGHHGQSFMSDANAVVISERAAAILQGFPDTWVFCGESKKARWSQIGQAMPPPLAHAVATSVVEQLEKTER